MAKSLSSADTSFRGDTCWEIHITAGSCITTRTHRKTTGVKPKASFLIHAKSQTQIQKPYKLIIQVNNDN